jgi:hypothetical protein
VLGAHIYRHWFSTDGHGLISFSAIRHQLSASQLLAN